VGVYTSVTEISESENIGKSYISRILRLALLAPDIVEAILAGRAKGTLLLETLERPLPASWRAQRAFFGTDLVRASDGTMSPELKKRDAS
jgi:hypothetical protein